MTKPAAIQGEFTDAKLIRTRSTLQLVVEVPIEAANAAMEALGGWPIPGGSRPVAVARLNSGAASDDTGLPRHPEAEAVEKSMQPDPHRLSRQAAMLCGDELFWQFLQQRGIYAGEVAKAENPEDTAATCVRLMCRVQSRAEFDTDDAAAGRWRALHAEFLHWQGVGQ